MEKIYTIEQAAEVLLVAPNKVRELLREGDLKGLKIGNRWRIKESALQSFIDSGGTAKGGE